MGNGDKELADQIQKIQQRLDDYYTSGEQVLWLTRPHPQLEGISALQAIENGDSQAVHTILDRLDACAYL